MQSRKQKDLNKGAYHNIIKNTITTPSFIRYYEVGEEEGFFFWRKNFWEKTAKKLINKVIPASTHPK